METPYNYIIEMTCDWRAFSWERGNLSEIFFWYDDHQAYTKPHPKTRQIVEDILWELRGRLGFDILAHHGAKGQKWGVRNGPPYLLDKNEKFDIIVDIETGKSIGVKSKNYDALDPGSGEYFHLSEGTRIRDAQVFAGKGVNKLSNAEVVEGLSEQIGGEPDE